jgi:putative endonuclease
MTTDPAWHLYMVRCRDGQLYTGVAIDVARRFEEHQGQGPRCARYLRGKGPLSLAFEVPVGSRGDALRLEMRVKAMSKRRKEWLVESSGAEAWLRALMRDG